MKSGKRMTYQSLLGFAERKMTMPHIYQPLMLHSIGKGQKGISMRNIIVTLLILISFVPLVLAAGWEELYKDGYAIVAETRVDGEFEGCDFFKEVQLMNGLVFVCSEYKYTYSYMPEVFILKHNQNGDLKIVIEDEEYDGTLY